MLAKYIISVEMELYLAIVVSLLVLVVFLILLKIYLKLNIGYCKSSEKMDGKTVIVTGANAGLGFECSLELAQRGARVILACRNEEKGIKAKDKIIEITGNKNVHVKIVDMTSFQSIRDFAQNVLESEQYIHVLVNNAGAGGLGKVKTKDGLLPVLQVNHYGPFLLTNLLLGRLKESAPSRIVTVASWNHEFAWFNSDDINQENWKYNSEFFTYNNSKLLNILMCNELARKLEGTGVTSNSLHPGVVRTEFLSPFKRILVFATVGLFFKSSREGAQTQIWLSVAPELKDTTGKYFRECRQVKTSAEADDAELARKVWDFSEGIVQLRDTERYY